MMRLTLQNLKVPLFRSIKCPVPRMVSGRWYSSAKDEDSLLAQAMAAQRKKEQTENAGTESAGTNASGDAEAERIKRVLDAADRQAEEKMKSQFKFTSFAMLLGAFSAYAYLGTL